MCDEIESKLKWVNKLNVATLSFIGKYCFVVSISICDAESHFNGDTDEK